MLTVVEIVSYAVSLPLLAALTAYMYFDLRVRKEGFDIQLLAQRMGTAVGETGRRRPAVHAAALVPPRSEPPAARQASCRRGPVGSIPDARARASRRARSSRSGASRSRRCRGRSRRRWTGSGTGSTTLGGWLDGRFDDVDGLLPGGGWVVWLLLALAFVGARCRGRSGAGDRRRAADGIRRRARVQ